MDKEGWQYAAAWESFDLRPNAPSRKDAKKIDAFCRRRRWVRLMHTEGQEGQSMNMIVMSRAVEMITKATRAVKKHGDMIGKNLQDSHQLRKKIRSSRSMLQHWVVLTDDMIKAHQRGALIAGPDGIRWQQLTKEFNKVKMQFRKTCQEIR